MPFVMGIEERLFTLAEEYLSEDQNIIFIIFISKNKITSNISINSNISLNEILGDLPVYPYNIYNDLNRHLNLLKQNVNITY